jgi:predicted enzyme related to lactoylglutathione lyase
MADLSHILLYVDNPLASAEFYGQILQREPIELSTGFSMFEFDNGMRLGLWARSEATPEATIAGGGGELVIMLEDEEEIDACHRDWHNLGICIIQTPMDMKYGRSFVALDPDGHRVRVFTPF